MKILILTNYANGLYLFRKELLQAFAEKVIRSVLIKQVHVKRTQRLVPRYQNSF